LIRILLGAVTALTALNCGNDPDYQERMRTDTPRIPLKEYTASSSGEWAGMEEEHLPQVTVIPGAVENVIIRVKFPLKHDPDHYITKIGIMDFSGKDVFVKNFNPDADNFEARFKVANLGIGYKAFARCSHHDLWTAPIE
jgi:desulfoferrodoxin (superoxide reductase-like protein)